MTTTGQQVTTERRTRGRRSDAVRNAEKVFAAALDVCARRGLDVGLPEVAAVAGVGRTTVYRSFASRDDLLAAVMAHKLAALATRIADVSRHENAWLGVREMILMLMEDVRTDRLLGEALLLRTDLFPAGAPAIDRLGALLERGRAQGALAPGLTGFDLRLLVAGVSHSMRMSGATDPAAWERAAELIAAAARGPGPPHP
ncbi:TetR/AcrR family transcriptional regulator [Pseudonocardia sp. GCM10023141]|uniref:TetR/AcrR family transcriptional regulator n=1 Tax=Pseudonocardia sp. GCM10023141 TaxID=3252653 RepID=UPI00360A8E98